MVFSWLMLVGVALLVNIALVQATEVGRIDLIKKSLFITDGELDAFLLKEEKMSREQQEVYSNEEQEARSYLVCMELSKTKTAIEAFTRELRGAQTIFTSKSENAVCFLVFDEPKTIATTISNSIGSKNLLIQVPMPEASKVSRSFFKKNTGQTSPPSLLSSFPSSLSSSVPSYSIISEAFQSIDVSEEIQFPSYEDNGDKKRPTVPKYARRAVDTLSVSFAPGANVPIGEKETHMWLSNKMNKQSSSTADSDSGVFWFSEYMHAKPFENENNIQETCDVSNLHFSYHSIKDKSKAGRTGHRRTLSTVAHLSGVDSLLSSSAELLDKEQCLLQLLSALAHDPSVIHLAPKAVHTPKNYRVAQLIQSQDNAASLSRTATPIWDFGLNGTGQVVGIADTGMDVESCFFSSSPSVSASVFSPSLAPTFDLSEPKVVQYVKNEGLSDYLDEYKGHGSHVAGTAIGHMGGGWPSSPVVDTCSDKYDNVSQCLLPDYYSDCSTVVGRCKKDFAFGKSDEGACAFTCQCSLGYVTQSNEMTCSELIAESNGVAFGAKVAFYDLGDSDGNLFTPLDLEADLYPIPYSTGCRIHSNSWGSVDSYTYEDDDLNTDSYLYDNLDFFILFAAGNDGDVGDYSIGSPAQSKNVLTVGASETGRWNTYGAGNYDPDIVASFSSQGPAEDGRIKPEVVAPGYYTMSAWGSGYNPTPTCKIHYEQGTSMATPATAGAAALVREYLSGSAEGGAASNSSLYAQHLTKLAEQINIAPGECIPGYPCKSGIPEPTGMLVKAALIHSTAAMTGWDNDDTDDTTVLTGPPDFSQGFGRISLEDVLLGPKDYPGQSEGIIGYGQRTSVYMVNQGSITSNEMLTYRFHLTSNLEPLKATLVWYDPPNSVSASKQLLHDLDLTITDHLSGTTYYSNGNSAASDELNPTEKVWIAAPLSQGSDYLINITSSVFTEAATQPFALVISGAGFYVDNGYTWNDIYTTPSPTMTPAPSLSQAPSTNFPTSSPKDDDDDDSGFDFNFWLRLFISSTVIFCGGSLIIFVMLKVYELYDSSRSSEKQKKREEEKP